MSQPFGGHDDNRWLLPQQAPFELRSLDLALARMVRQRTGSTALARLSAWLSAAERQGHASLTVTPEQMTSALDQHTRARDWVGDGAALTPLVWRDGQLSLWRNWRHEAVIAADLRLRAAALVCPTSDSRADLDALYPDSDSAEQRAAVSAALGRGLFVLTGGPGTGKTSTVLRLLLMLRLALPEDADALQIALAAPTGKAAARLAESVNSGKQALRESLTEARWRLAIDRVPEQAATLHRLLGYHPATDRFARNRKNPLAADVVVVDEASMVDLAMMRALIEALRADATLILVGDADQLVSVSAGSVLADLVEAAGSTNSPLSHSVARLTRVWRTSGGLAEVYESLRQGDAGALSEALQQPDQSRCRLRRCVDADQLHARIHQWLADPHVLASLCPGADIEAPQALRLMGEHQLLCATRGGAFGAATVNTLIDAQLRARIGQGGLWYAGRRIIITRNDYGRRLFNGDVGIALWADGALRVYFSASEERTGGCRSLLPQELPEHDLAFAMTIHKSQGSEYRQVGVILPPDPGHPLLSRQLLYTAVSRAKLSAELWTSAEALQAALQRVVRRQGGLLSRLGGEGGAQAEPAL